jgi:carbonyl reductase 1
MVAVRQLALQYPKSSFNNGPLLIYLTARDEGRGQKALADLRNDALLKQAKALRSNGGLTDIEYHPLDISDEGSIVKLRDFLKEKHPDGVDIGMMTEKTSQICADMGQS